MRPPQRVGTAAALAAGLLAFTSRAPAEMIWDNGIDPNGWNARALQSIGPRIRVVDDFVLTQPTTITEASFTLIEDEPFEHGGVTTVYVFNDADGKPARAPRGLHSERTVPHIRVPLGVEYFGRAAYRYGLKDLNIDLPDGRFWIGLKQPRYGGAGTSWWLTSDGGPHGRNSSTGYLSLDAGGAWSPEGARWHHAFVLTTPEPGTLALFALGALCARRR